MSALVLKWRGEGCDVKVAGEFSNWQPKETLKDGDSSVFKAEVKPGRYFYKWVIDGNWLVDETEMTEVDQDGNRNNVALVEEKIEDIATDTVDHPIGEQPNYQQQPEVVQTNKVEESADQSGEVSGDSDSWERVSVEDCAISSTEELSNMQLSSPPTTMKQDVVLQPTSSIIKKKIDRIFTPDTDFFNLANSLGSEVIHEDYPIFYWDTPNYTLMKKGVWCKQVKDQWLLRKLEGRGIKTTENLADIQDSLELLLGYKASIDEYLEKTLTKQVKFLGAVTKWELEGCQVEHLREGDFYTVHIRLEDTMVEGLNRIYSLANKLQLKKLKLETKN